MKRDNERNHKTINSNILSQKELELSELPAGALFKRLGYTRVNGTDIKREKNTEHSLLLGRLESALRRIHPWMENVHVDKAIEVLVGLHSKKSQNLFDCNQKIWNLISGKHENNMRVSSDKGDEFHAVSYIDYDNIENNDFLVVHQYHTNENKLSSYPDLVVFVNGLPLAVIECKSPTAHDAWNSAYNDLKSYQESLPLLFSPNQICCALWKVGARYGAIGTPQRFYSEIKKLDAEGETFFTTTPTAQDILIYTLFRKDRFVQFIRDYVLFEFDDQKTIKKLPRPQQLRATEKVLARLRKDKGGVVWHTQGSGKSITMVYLARKLRVEANGFKNPTILVLTDRTDLDEQITNTIRNSGMPNVRRAGSVRHLKQLLNDDYGGIITSTLHKFQEEETLEEDSSKENNSSKSRGSKEKRKETEEYGSAFSEDKFSVERTIVGDKLIKRKYKVEYHFENSRKEEKKILLEEVTIPLVPVSEKTNLYVFIDEAHRTQYGFLAAMMRVMMPNAKFVAFTGTPISNKDKSTLGTFYGGQYIDTYTIKEAVEDGATVPLFYEEGVAMLSVKSEALDREFREKYKGIDNEKRYKLKTEGLKAYQKSTARIDVIVRHMVDHYKKKIYPAGQKAMVVCSGREAAIKYHKALLQLKEEGVHDFEAKVVVSLGIPKSDPIAKQYYEIENWNKDHSIEKKPQYIVDPLKVKDVVNDFKLPFKKDVTKETEKYDNTAFMIVSDMLITGWDAPIASCLYLDKGLKEHTLLQAIARVNRVKEGKVAGFIVDYCGVAANLIDAIAMFSGDIEREDVITDLKSEIPKLEINRNRLLSFFHSIQWDRVTEREEYVDSASHYLEPLDIRDEFKDLLKSFNRSINIVLPNTKALEFQDDFYLFNEINRTMRNLYIDENSLSKEESRTVQKMIDDHLESNGMKVVFDEPLNILDSDKLEEQVAKYHSNKSKALVMRRKLIQTIATGERKNPDFYEPLSKRLNKLLEKKEQGQLDDKQLMLEFIDMFEVIREENSQSNNQGFEASDERALYTTMKTISEEDAVEMTRDVFANIRPLMKMVQWQSNSVTLKKIENKIKNILTQKMDSSDARAKAKEMVETIKQNNDVQC